MSKLQRITFGGEPIGDYAFVSIDYSGNTSVRIIPRAQGVKIYSTEEMGGGQQTFKVRAFVLKTTRQNIEKYLADLHQLIGNSVSNLQIYDKNGTNPETYNNCYMSRISSGTEDELWNWFDIEFVRSI